MMFKISSSTNYSSAVAHPAAVTKYLRKEMQLVLFLAPSNGSAPFHCDVTSITTKEKHGTNNGLFWILVGLAT